MSGQLATSETILVSAAGVIAADSAGLSSVKSYSALLTSIAAMPLAGGTFTGNVLFTDNTYTIGAAGATRPSAVHVGTGGVTSAGDIIASGSSQRYVRAYATDGVKNVACYHNSTNGIVSTSSGNVILSPAGTTCITAKSNAEAEFASHVLLTTENRGVYFGSRGQVDFRASGWCRLTDYATTGFSGLNLGPETASFPAIKRSGTTVAFRLGNDSADAPISCDSITASGIVSVGTYTVATLPAAGSNAYKMANVSDSNAAASGNYGATVAGGGSNKVRVFSDGTNWVIA